MAKVVFDARMHRGAGIGVYISNLLNGFSKHGISKDLAFLSAKEFGQFGKIKHLRAVSPIYSMFEQIELPVVAEGAQVFHSPHYNVPLFWGGSLVVTVHDLIHLRLYDQLPSMFHRLYARYMLLLALKKAEQVITDSNYSRTEILRRWPEMCGKVTTIYCGIKGDQPVISKSEISRAKEAYRISGEYALFVGRLKKHKNLKRLVSGFMLSRKAGGHKCQLVIVGNLQSADEETRQLIDSCANNGSVKWIGFVPDGRLEALYAGASLFAFPSLAEGFGLPPLEAMSHGVPVISSRATCLPEVLGNAPLYFDPLDEKGMAESIVRGLSDEKWRDLAVVRGRNVVRKYKWETACSQCIEIYDKLLKKTV